MINGELLRAPRDEAQAFEIAESGWLQRTGLALRSGAQLALNPGDTQQVFYLAIAVDRNGLPRVLDKLERDPDGAELLRTKPAIDSSTVARLRALPAETLGGAYARMLDSNGLDADLFQRPASLPEDIGYVAQRIRQTHDLWHVLTGLGTEIPSEIALQAFSYAQLGQRFSFLIATFGTLFYGLRYPGTLRKARAWYRTGSTLPFLLAVKWEDLWTERLDDVRARFGLTAEARA
jgi:ubiquinone biosynthesis protein COQ4